MLTPINGTRLFIREEGQGPALVFLHGFPFNHRMWDAQVPALAAHCRLLRYDQRGHGQSDVGDAHFTIDFLVDDLLAILDSRGVDKAILCGLSMGGYVALRTIERAPERVSALVLCDTKSGADSDAVRIKRSASLAKVQREGVQAFADAFLPTVFPAASFEKRGEVVEAVKNMITSTSPKGIAGILMALAARTDTTGALGSIRVPTLIMVGAQDAVTPPAEAEAMKARIAGSELTILPEAGHLSNMEQPVLFNERLVHFLKTVL